MLQDKKLMHLKFHPEEEDNNDILAQNTTFNGEVPVNQSTDVEKGIIEGEKLYLLTRSAVIAVNFQGWTTSHIYSIEDQPDTA